MVLVADTFRFVALTSRRIHRCDLGGTVGVAVNATDGHPFLQKLSWPPSTGKGGRRSISTPDTSLFSRFQAFRCGWWLGYASRMSIVPEPRPGGFLRVIVIAIGFVAFVAAFVYLLIKVLRPDLAF